MTEKLLTGTLSLNTTNQVSRQRITKALIRLHGCAGWSAPLLFTYSINRFSHYMAHMHLASLFGDLGTQCRPRLYATERARGPSSRPTVAVLCPWARHFTPRKYWLITQEAMAPSRHDWKIVDWDVKPQHNHPTIQAANNKGADQTARMRRLICAFVVHIWHKQVFSLHGSYAPGIPFWGP